MCVASACGNDRWRASGDDALACETIAVMRTHCTSCHDDPPKRGAPSPLTSLDHLRGQSAVFAGTSLGERAMVRIHDPARPMPPTTNDPIPVEAIAVIETWIGAGMPACAEDPGAQPESEPNQIPQSELFTCEAEVAASSPARIRRLDAAEWRRDLPNVSDRQNISLARVNPLAANASHPYSTYAADETIDDLVLDLMLEPGLLGGTIGDEIVKHLGALRPTTPTLGCMFTQTAPGGACISDFVTVLLERAVLFRPPTAAEVTRLVALASTIVGEETALAERPASLSQVANAAWLGAAALYRTELGAGPEDAAGRRRLGDDELAHALAYLIAARAPGAPRQAFKDGYSADLLGHVPAIAAAAKDGTIQDPLVLAGLVRQYAAGMDPDRLDLTPDLANVESRRTHGAYWTSDPVRGFFREWLGYAKVSTAFKDQPGKTSQFLPTGAESIYSPMNTSWNQLQGGFYQVTRAGVPGSYKESLLVDQLDDVIARTVVEDTAVLATLLTTSRFHVPAQYEVFNATQETQRPYNLVEHIAPDARDNRWVTLPETERAGVLTHPAWLAAHGGNFDDDPSAIHRGWWIRESLLCQFVPPLSAVQVEAMVGPSDPMGTARTRIETATSSELCQGCHRLMNGLGLAFEIYNHAGFVREVDHDGGAPNGSMALVDSPDPALDGEYASAIELSHALADSTHVKRCFVRQAFRYYMGRPETRADACALAAMETAYDRQGSFVELLVALVQSDTFRYVHTEAE